jgi:hypothetical protein
MNIQRKIILFCAVNFMITSCSSGWKTSDKMEGLRKDKLRVYVRTETGADMDDGKHDEDLKKIFLDIAVKRAGNLAGSHLLMKRPGMKITEAVLREMVDFKNPKIVNQHCHDDFCEAFIDFPAKGIVEKLKTGN